MKVFKKLISVAVATNLCIITLLSGVNFMAGAETTGRYEKLTYVAYENHVEITDCDESVIAVIIPSKIGGLPVKGIGEYAFYNCRDLISIVIPKSVTSFGTWAFLGTPWLETKQNENPLVVVNGVLIDGKKFSGEAIIPDGVTTIGNAAFLGSSMLTGVTIPKGVTNIEEDAFNNCEALTYVTLPASLTTIEKGAFLNCSSLTSITIPRNVTSIGRSAFYYCKSLTDITIFNNIKTIEKYAFYNCDSLSNVYYTGSDEIWNLINIGEFNDALVNAKLNFIKPPYIAGDVDGNGKLNLQDAVDISLHNMNMLTFTEEQIEIADYTGDGKVGLIDVVGVATAILPSNKYK